MNRITFPSQVPRSRRSIHLIKYYGPDRNLEWEFKCIHCCDNRMGERVSLIESPRFGLFHFIAANFNSYNIIFIFYLSHIYLYMSVSAYLSIYLTQVWLLTIWLVIIFGIWCLKANGKVPSNKNLFSCQSDIPGCHSRTKRSPLSWHMLLKNFAS